ncbi:MAG TPA: FAD-binding oxidoreductase [Puia sp.]|jgi:4-methylaminobutanoate oxidase (formaldehyde-forming)|nr:FAD-binding oxidoreductase [Puia sp.]
MTQLSAGKADLVVIGGGIFGCAIAYYYSRNHPEKKIVVLERGQLCSGATSRAAALLTRVRSKKYFIPLSLETYRVIEELESQLSESLGLRRVGVMHLASSETNKSALMELMETAKEFKQPAEYISFEEAHKKSPWLQTTESVTVGFMPGEAYCDPYLLGTFFARCAKMNGAEIRQGVEVLQLIMDGDKVAGVTTALGRIYAAVVVLATGAWAPLLAAQAGIALPMAPVRSQYWITETGTLYPPDSPIVLLPDAHAYARPEGGGLLFGIRERNSFSVSPADIPADLAQFSFSPDRGIQDLDEVIESLGRFFPKVYDVGIKYYIAGFCGYTPDNNLSMGPAPGVSNLLLATGCVGAGISVSGGVGLAFSEMAAGNANPFDFSHFDLERFGKIDPFSREWLNKCGLARSKKTSG